MHTIAVVNLPPGYRVEWVESQLRLVDSQGHVLAVYPASPPAFATIEEHAWQHAWGQIEVELHQEVRALRTRSRKFADLRRMKQYVGLIEAFAGVPPEITAAGAPAEPVRMVPRRARHRRRLVVAGGVAVAAALIGILLSAADVPAPSVSNAPPPGPDVVISDQPAQIAPPVRQAVPQPAPGETRRPSRIARQVRPAIGYAIAFGRFTNFETAQGFARSVRAKGYLATVVRAGRSFQVLGRVYRTRTQAERMARALREIALPASVQVAGL